MVKDAISKVEKELINLKLVFVAYIYIYIYIYIKYLGKYIRKKCKTFLMVQ